MSEPVFISVAQVESIHAGQIRRFGGTLGIRDRGGMEAAVFQPQSSCPFKSARQKIFGLGYSLLVFVYDKSDDAAAQAARLDIQHTIFIEKERTADFQTTSGLLRLLENQANRDDLLAFFSERMLPLDDIAAGNLADEVLRNPPALGYLTISNALQWRLQYSRAIEKAGAIEGLLRLK